MLEFKMEINANPEYIWYALWNDFYYRQWTNAFQEGSYYVTNWIKGERIQFLGPDGNGMYSIITKNIPFEKMYFKHIGEIKNFKELPLDKSSEQWTGANELYLLAEHNGVTTVTVKLDNAVGHAEYFKEAFTKGLAIVKSASEHLMLVVQTKIKASASKIWEYWTSAPHIMQWNNASEDWHTPKAENDLRTGGLFVSTMAAKDGSMSFDFKGTYTDIIANRLIKYTLADGRKVSITFVQQGDWVTITESFEPELTHTLAIQQSGWQAILDNFKKYVTSKNP